ncbi:transposable element Tcb1 transposase [Trichonephila clavipes]|nr:transposable element Tcb1 transposase [Trichonephila clavipes]
MAQMKHLDDFLRSSIIGRLECERTQLEVSEELGIVQNVHSKLWQRFQDVGNVSSYRYNSFKAYRYRRLGHIGLYARRPTRCAPLTATHCSLRITWRREHALWTPQLWSCVMFSDESRMARLGGILLGSRTDLHLQSVTMTCHIYRDVILKQHERLFRDALGAEFLFMDDNARPHRTNIVNGCL